MSELALQLIAENKRTKNKSLDLGNCGLTSLPTGIKDLVWLEELILSNGWPEYRDNANREDRNGIRSLAGVEKLTALKKLVVSRHDNRTESRLWDLSDLSPLVGLTNLHQLYCSNIQITEIAPLSGLTDLQYLDCSHTKITDIAPLSGLTDLQYLDCSYTTITDLRPLARLINLLTLNCSFTQISSLKPLTALIKLENLRCGNIRLSDFYLVANLYGLKLLDLSFNNIVNIEPLSKLKHLEVLNIYGNQIESISALSYLYKLKTLNVCQNKLMHIPADVYVRLIENCDLDALIEYMRYLKNNFVRSQQYENAADARDIEDKLMRTREYIKVEIGKGMKTKGILYKDFSKWFFGANPLITPPMEVFLQGNEAILRYFDEKEKAGTDEIYEAKLLLIGEGGAGKTTLCRKLFDAKADLPKEKDSTQGIDIKPLYFDIPNGKQFRLNVWDFAGQGKYQSAHSFFYTHRSLYVLVDDTRTLDENEAYRTFYNHWLQTAELFGGNSPLLVLHNQKADRTRTGFNLGSFQATFPFVKDLFQINLGGNDTVGIQDLKSQIERWAQKLPHIGDVVPKTWVKVREDIETERQARPYISYERYQEICIAHGITNELKQSDLSHYFHDLGVFLHFQANPLLRRDVFLQNQWVTDAVYKILDDNDITTKNRGRFDKIDLARLWNEGLYVKRRDELLALMLQFELCYQVQDTETYVAPQLLPGDVPPYDLGTDIPLQLKYEYGFMPKGLLYRLIVRLHRHIAQQQSAVWNSGVVLERTDSQADILESLDRRQISVRATGVRAKELVTIINEEVEKLHASYGDRLKVEVKIPCNCRVCKAGKTPHFYDKKDLDNRLAKGKPTVECKESFDDVNVQGLLDGIFVKNFKNEKSKRMKKIFISYSHEDEPLKKELDNHLSALKRSGLVEVWHDRRIDAGTEWDDEIKTELEAADIILLLVSANFLASDYIWKVEIAKAMERHQAKETRVIPIFLRACDITDMPFAGLQGMPRDAKPVISFPDRDEAYLQIAKGIRNVLEA